MKLQTKSVTDGISQTEFAVEFYKALEKKFKGKVIPISLLAGLYTLTLNVNINYTLNRNIIIEVVNRLNLKSDTTD